MKNTPAENDPCRSVFVSGEDLEGGFHVRESGPETEQTTFIEICCNLRQRVNKNNRTHEIEGEEWKKN